MGDSFTKGEVGWFEEWPIENGGYKVVQNSGIFDRLSRVNTLDVLNNGWPDVEPRFRVGLSQQNPSKPPEFKLQQVAPVAGEETSWSSQSSLFRYPDDIIGLSEHATCPLPTHYSREGGDDGLSLSPVLVKLLEPHTKKGEGLVATQAMGDVLNLIGVDLEQEPKYREIINYLMGVLNGCPNVSAEHGETYFWTNYIYSLLVEALAIVGNSQVLRELGYQSLVNL